jgi:hypothetical protein
VFNASLTRQRRKTLSLRLFALDARLPRVLQAKDAPGASQRTAQSRLVIQIALDDLIALVRQRRGPLAFRLARQATADGSPWPEASAPPLRLAGLSLR